MKNAEWHLELGKALHAKNPKFVCPYQWDSVFGHGPITEAVICLRPMEVMTLREHYARMGVLCHLFIAMEADMPNNLVVEMDKVAQSMTGRSMSGHELGQAYNLKDGLQLSKDMIDFIEESHPHLKREDLRAEIMSRYVVAEDLKDELGDIDKEARK